MYMDSARVWKTEVEKRMSMILQSLVPPGEGCFCYSTYLGKGALEITAKQVAVMYLGMPGLLPANKKWHYCRASCVLSRYCLIRSYSAEAMTEKMMSMTFSMAIRDPMAPLLMVTSGEEM